METPMKKPVLLMFALLPLVAFADGHDPIADRQALMEGTRDALRPLIGMTRGQVEFDANTVSESLAVFANTAEEAPSLFPEGSETGGDTEAKATIWSDRAGFDQAFVDFGNAVAAAQEADIQTLEQLQPQLQGVLKTCKGCHDGYRVDDD
jgi:cytochrome c556